MKKILVTGFEPFNGQTENPSKWLATTLEPPEGAEVERLILPVEFHGAARILEKAIDAVRPDILLSIGQAGNVPGISVERTAVNLDSSLSADGLKLLADNSGFAPLDEPICPDGPAAYFSRLPVRSIVEALNAAGIIEGYFSNGTSTYKPNNTLTRGQVSAIVWRMKNSVQ